MSRLALAAPALVPTADGVDATLQRYFGPFAEGLAGIVFYAVPIFGTEVPLIVGWLSDRGYDVTEQMVVADGHAVGDALRAALAERVDLIITSGGTGISPTDATPESTSAVLDYQIPGLADAIRRVLPA